MIGLEDYAQNILKVSRVGFDHASPAERDIGIEGCIIGYVRLALLYWPAAKVAEILRQLADTIDDHKP